MKKIFLLLGRIFYWIWKLFTTGCLVMTNLFILAIAIVVLTVFFEPDIKVPEGCALVVAPVGDIVEQRSAISPVSRIVNGFAGVPLPKETFLQDILDGINSAAEDNRIKIIVLSLAEMTNGSLDQYLSIGKALNRFKEAGKKIIAVDDTYNQGQYFLASYADEIYINPMGYVGIQGFAVYRLYMKDLIDKLAVNFHIFKVGSFKSATDPFLRNDMSEEEKVANRLWVTNLWELFCAEIAHNRGMKPDQINSFINSMPEYLRQSGGSTSQMAMDTQLVDGIMTRNEIEGYLSRIVGRSPDRTTFNSIHLSDYLRVITPSFTEGKESDNWIGLIVAQGNIIYGEKVPGQISSDHLCSLIRQARKNNKVKALILRIDSGGGSALASEQIRQELIMLQKSGKKLVVSMGSMAASGAYWISAPADRIYAAPSTLTGSIGIFGIIPTVEESISKIGIHSDGIKTTRMAGAGNPTVPFPPEFGETIQLSIEEGYKRFLTVVSEGRNIPMENVEKLARGRVWDGTTAKELGLVDDLGDMDDAIAAAAKLANVKNFSPLYIMEEESSGSQFLKRLGVEAVNLFQKYNLLGTQTIPFLTELQKNFDFAIFENDPGNIYAHSLLPEPGISF